MRSVIVILSGAIALASTRLEAQTIPSPFDYIETTHSVSAYVGHLWTGAVQPDVGPGDGLIFGGRYNLHLSGPVLLEFGLAFAPSTRRVFFSPGADPAELEELGETSVVAMLLEGGLRMNLTGQRTWNGLTPYVSATMGAVLDASGADPGEGQLPVDQVFEFGPGFAASLGLGTDFFLSERLSIRAEVRDHLWRLTVPTGLANVESRDAQWRHNFGITLGTTVHF